MAGSDEGGVDKDLERALSLSEKSYALERMQRSAASGWTLPEDFLLVSNFEDNRFASVFQRTPSHSADGSMSERSFNMSRGNSQIEFPSVSGNLIDFSAETSTTNSLSEVLETFDPFSNSKLKDSTESPLNAEVDPFDGRSLVVPKTLLPRSDSLENKTSNAPKKVNLPCDKKECGLSKSWKYSSPVNEEDFASCDRELLAYVDFINRVLSTLKPSDFEFNSGLVLHPEGQKGEGTFFVNIYFGEQFLLRTPCSPECRVDTLISYILGYCELPGDSKQYILVRRIERDRPDDISGIIEEKSMLGLLKRLQFFPKYNDSYDLELFSTLHRNESSSSKIRKPLICPEDVCPSDSVYTVPFEHVRILLETLEMQSDRLLKTVDSDVKLNYASNIYYSVKGVCTILGNLETKTLSKSCMELFQVCVPSDGSENLNKPIQHVIKEIFETISVLIDVYYKTFRVDFSLQKEKCLGRTSCQTLLTIEKERLFTVKILALHRLRFDWGNYEKLGVSICLYHGLNRITKPKFTSYHNKSVEFYECVFFDSDLELCDIRSIPKEARLVLTIYGKESGTLKDLGWASLQVFDCERLFVRGVNALLIWPPEVEKEIGPAPDPRSHPNAERCPVLSVEIQLPFLLSYPLIEQKEQIAIPFDSLDSRVKSVLEEMCDMDLESFDELDSAQKFFFWDNRLYLTEISHALPKVLMCCPHWDVDKVGEIYGLLNVWKRPLYAVEALVLLHPRFPDLVVRSYATKWLNYYLDLGFGDYLPHLIQILKFETWTYNSPVVELLVRRCINSPEEAHEIYMLISNMLPSQNHHASEYETRNDDISTLRHKRRLQIFIRTLHDILGEDFQLKFSSEQSLLILLNEAAVNVRSAKDSSRGAVLRKFLRSVDSHLRSHPSPLPIQSNVVVEGLDLDNCSYFTSNAVPLKLCFEGSETKVLYKIGEDLRQDQLLLLLIRVMSDIWNYYSLDFKLVSFSCLPTGPNSGMIELVSDAKTLREIQVADANGVAGSFKDKTIFEWLKKKNDSSMLEFATDKFSRSCAAYCVITYILGICDRHNDNIMITKQGNMFHIDFGKVFGDAQTFGSFKRDRTPFVLTSDMVYVINAYEPELNFQKFVDTCCLAFNIIRKNGSSFLNLLDLMMRAGIPGLTPKALNYVRSALLLDLSLSEAAVAFSRMIEESLSSWFTQWNFFIHNLSQVRSSSNQNSKKDSSDCLERNKPLSFIDGRYTLEDDGLIVSVSVYGIQKRYQPEKHYVFILQVVRDDNQSYLFRTYQEFCELESTIQRNFPEYNRRSKLQKGMILFGRQEIHEVAERRKQNVSDFITYLFSSTSDIKYSELVYTFFHPMSRDKEESNVHFKKLKNNNNISESSNVNLQSGGRLKLSLEYRGNSLFIMVHHAINISDSPLNSYVKMYLYPGDKKDTKRKTKIVKRNVNPSFMELISYKIPRSTLKSATLYVTVWGGDIFQGNIFLGAVVLPLDHFKSGGEGVWYPLTNLNRPV